MRSRKPPNARLGTASEGRGGGLTNGEVWAPSAATWDVVLVEFPSTIMGLPFLFVPVISSL